MSLTIGTVLTACNAVSQYEDFIPIFIETWKTILPEADICILYIHHRLPTHLQKYKKHIQIFPIFHNISSAFVSQNIRILYPSLVERDDGVIITDIDMIPLSRDYFTTSLKTFSKKDFVSFRPVLKDVNQVPIIYNVATPSTWQKVNKLNNENMLRSVLSKMYEKTNYQSNIENQNTNLSWYNDQEVLFKMLTHWDNNNTNWIVLSDQKTKFKRLDGRNHQWGGGPFWNCKEVKENVLNDTYKDYHMRRPFKDHIETNNTILSYVKEKYNDTVFTTSSTKKVVSFCLYGKEPKYTKGMIENIQLIQKHLSDYEVWVYMGCDVKKSVKDEIKRYKNVRVFETRMTGPLLMCYRLFAIDYPSVSIAFSRDADSRVTERDVHCMREFELSDKSFHVIRDHIWHKCRILIGMCGMKSTLKKVLKHGIQGLYNQFRSSFQDKKLEYGSDTIFGEEYLYPKIKDDILVHSSMVGFKGEDVKLIPPLKDKQNFIGNVYEYDLKDLNLPAKPSFTYTEGLNLYEHILWLYEQEQWSIITRVLKNLSKYTLVQVAPKTIQRHQMLHILVQATLNQSPSQVDLFKCIEILSWFHTTFITKNTVNLSNQVFQKLKEKDEWNIHGTTCSTLEQKERTILIEYGNYPMTSQSLVYEYNFKKMIIVVHRHPMFVASLEHQNFHYAQPWEKIEQIYILNLKERYDRYLEVLVELCRMEAPLDRIYHYEARKEVVTGDSKVDSLLGAGKNHIDVITHFIKNEYQHCLILEDDVTFTCQVNQHLKDLETFFRREYKFDICFITASQFYEWRKYDDLLSNTFQECTTSSGYLLSKDTAQKVLDVLKEGNDLLQKTKDCCKYCCDRYWSKIQKDKKCFIFNQKFGYQRPNFSNITKKTQCHFD